MSVEVDVGKESVKYPLDFHVMGSRCPVLGKFGMLYSKLSSIVSA